MYSVLGNWRIHELNKSIAGFNSIIDLYTPSVLLQLDCAGDDAAVSMNANI